MSDWEDFADENVEIEDKTADKKFAEEELVDKDKEEREKKEREKQREEIKKEIEENAKEKKANEKDYEKLYNDRVNKNSGSTKKNLTREEMVAANPGLNDAQIDELMSRQADGDLGDELFANDTETDPQTPKKSGIQSTITELKGEKNYKAFGKEVAQYIVSEGQNHNHIPRFFSELFHELSEKLTTTKMKNIVSDFDKRLQKRIDEEKQKEAEEKKLAGKTAKGKKKAKLAGVSKGANDANQLMMDDVFDEDAEGEYGDYGDEYVDYGRDDIDFM